MNTVAGSSTPLVSILIPVHNGLGFTQACLESIWTHANDAIPCEILVLDDLSTDGTAEYLEALGSRIRVLHSPPQTPFAEKMNEAAERAEGEYLCLLNNDTLVTKGWLEELLVPIRQDPEIAVVGNRHLTPETGQINHAGMVFQPNGSPSHLYRGEPSEFWPARISQEFQCLTAACWMIAKRRFIELGKFDTAFRNGFEDVDFCLRARKKGFRVFYNADSVIYHHGVSTEGRMDHEAANLALFLIRWGESLVRDAGDFYYPPPPPPAQPPPVLQEPRTVPASVDVPAELSRKRSHIEERYAEIEYLHARHPLIASLLRSMVRFATSTAKLLNRRKI